MAKRSGNPLDFESFLSWEALVSILSYDPATGEFRWKETRHNRVKIGQIAGCIDDREYAGYRRIEILGRGFYASRLAWLYMTKKWPTTLVDHKNGNPADDRWDNLRLASRKQNSANRKLSKKNTSGINGVYRLPSGKWAARVAVNGKKIYLGSFFNLEDAANASRKFNVMNFGDFVRSA